MSDKAQDSASGIRLDAFLLAEGVALHDYRAFVHGGGMTRIDVPAIPWVQSQISVFARFVGERTELEGSHTASIRLSDPAGNDLIPDTGLPFVARPSRDLLTDEEQALTLSVTLGPLPLQEEGVYTLELRFDEQLVRRMKLPVRAVDLSTPASGWTQVSLSDDDDQG